ncbi:Uncharacterized protein PBTT_05936 [Plasmodiophora brassicae]
MPVFRRKSINKFVECMEKALNEEHSLWKLENYTDLAKNCYYVGSGKKRFMFDLAWAEVRSLPKFAVNQSRLT